MIDLPCKMHTLFEHRYVTVLMHCSHSHSFSLKPKHTTVVTSGHDFVQLRLHTRQTLFNAASSLAARHELYHMISKCCSQAFVILVMA